MHEYDNSWQFRDLYLSSTVKLEEGWHANRYFNDDREPYYPSIVVDDFDKINFVYQDSSDGNFDIFLSKDNLVSSINSNKSKSISDFLLFQNYPNPFNSTTIINYIVPVRAFVKIQIFNLLGRNVKSLISKSQNPGRKTTSWDGTDCNGKIVSSGSYFCVLSLNDKVRIRKLLFLK